MPRRSRQNRKAGDKKTRSRSSSAAARARKADPVESYARDVLSGEIITGRWVRLACERHLRDLSEGRKRGLRWSWPRAQHAIQFFEQILVFTDGSSAGQKFKLQPWQKFVIGSLFGWIGLDGYRRYRTAYIEVGKGNGKSPMAAGIGLYCLVADGEAGAQVYSAATMRDQAKIVWSDADKMVKASTLRPVVDCFVNNLTFEGSFFRPLSADHSKLDGLRVHCAILDEVHEHPSSRVVDKITAGTKGRRQPLIVEITNAGFDRHSVCWQHHEYSAKILEQVLENDSWFGFIAAVDDEDDPLHDESCWIKANPNLGVSITEKYLREQVRSAIAMPAKQNIVLRLNFTRWTEQSIRWLSLTSWDEGGKTPIDEQVLRGRECYAGLDLARVSDLTALALLFPPDELGELWKVIMRYWVPEEDINTRSVRDRVPYDVWTRDGLIRVTPGNTTDFKFVEKEILDLAALYELKELAYDRMFAGELVNNLVDEGITMVPFGQGFLSMATPTQELERKVKAGEILHGGHPVLRWNASNVAVQQDAAGGIKPDKERSVERIDGIVALIMALGRAMVRDQNDGGSVYASRGIRTL